MAPAAPVLLIPPSEGKAEGGDGAPVDWGGGRFGNLVVERLTVRDAVRRVLAAGAGGPLLGVRGPHLERALDEWTHMDASPTMSAAGRYTGVVWGGIDIASLPAPARRRAMSRIVVTSGLWGLVGAADAIPAYRLKMGARVDGLGSLAAWWRPAVSGALARRAGRGVVIDMLPLDHRAVIDPAALRSGSLVRVGIVEDGPGGRRAAGHAGKHLKGLLARAIVEHDARTLDDVAAVRVDGLSLLSVERGEVAEVTFLREG